ncbi:hypothetical protein CC78DRAFT_580559 [Lojkania enalia]|uniref:Uncharacterized protein n=1 Tax=Lojkania enalia TaxID=147567 RepID=A0A9P4KDT8_9PLEO|nr:hypothetical protein CC78DRAFT_580559 [Didymosphaeria enalia]
MHHPSWSLIVASAALPGTARSEVHPLHAGSLPSKLAWAFQSTGHGPLFLPAAADWAACRSNLFRSRAKMAVSGAVALRSLFPLHHPSLLHTLSRLSRPTNALALLPSRARPKTTARRPSVGLRDTNQPSRSVTPISH